MTFDLSGQLICASEAELEIVLRHLPAHIQLSRAEPECLRFDVVQTADPMIWQVDESFASQAGFDAHQIRTRASAWFVASAEIQRRFQISHD